MVGVAVAECCTAMGYWVTLEYEELEMEWSGTQWSGGSGALLCIV